jgi:ankyrin repeat protein
VTKRINSRGWDDVKKRRVLDRVISNAEATGIFQPTYLEDKDIALDLEKASVIEFSDPIARSDLVRKKQEELGILAEVAAPKEVNGRWGRSNLHEAVLMGDEGLVRRYLEDGEDATVFDNNGRTPYDLSILRENERLIALFEELKADF